MNTRRIFSDAGVSAIRMVLGIITGIVIIPVITRLMGEGAYGIWVTIMSVISLLTLIGGLHLHGALIRYSGGEQDSTVFSDTLFLSVVAASITVLLVVIGTFSYDRVVGFKSIPSGIFLPTALLAGTQILKSFLFNYSRAKQRVKRYEGMKIVWNVLRAVTLVALLWWTQDIVVALWGILAVTIVINLLLLDRYRQHITFRPNPSNFKQYLNYSVPMIFKGAAGSLLHNADKFLILYYIGPVGVGIYAVGYSIGTIFSRITGLFNSTLYPNVMQAWKREEFSELERFFNKFLRWYTILTVPAIVGLVLLGAPALRFISTPTIATRGEPLVPVLALAFAFQGLEFALSYPLQAAERTKLIATITVAAVGLNLLLNIALIPLIGLFGAALATLIAFAVRSILLYWYTTAHLDLSLPKQGFSYSVGAAGIMLLVLYTLPIESWYWQLGLYPPIGAVCFTAVFVAAGGVQDEEWNLLRKKLSTSQSILG